jgi:hypothetical protein
MSPEDADEMFWSEMGKMDWHNSAGHPKTQHELRMHCWTVLIAHIRGHYQEETERLREENRVLKSGYLSQIEQDAKPPRFVTVENPPVHREVVK